MRRIIITSMLLFVSFQLTYCQSNAVKKYLKKEEEQQKKDFPNALLTPFPTGSLGDKIQNLYEVQAKDACGIIRNDKRLYIPREIISGYGESRLRSTMIYDIPISSTNLLFLALTPSDINKINDGTFNEQEYINAKRILGINDNLVNFGQSVLSPINGFPSLFFQKSCGSYFVGDITTKIKAPIAELEASLDAETKKSSSITTVTGNFFSPLFLILRQNTAQSTYAHLLLWEIYYEDYKNVPNGAQNLYNSGKYISEFKATMTHRAINSDQSINMNGRLSTNISLGILSASGNVNVGNDNKVSFDLKDFSTSIHKLANGNLSWDLNDLPRIEQINQKLQNSPNFKAQPSMSGFVTHLLPTEITRILVGIPASLCDKNSWNVNLTGYNTGIWRDKPMVVSNWVSAKDNELPECICKVTGFIKKEAIDNAVRNNGFLELSVTLDNKNDIKGQKLNLIISEPTVRVTDNPKVPSINSELINATRQEIRTSNKVLYNFPIQFTINATGIQLTDPYKISNLQIEYVNKDNEGKLSITNEVVSSGNSIKLDIKSSENPQNYIQQGDIVIPIKIKFNIELRGGTTTQLVTNTINLNLPNLVERIDIKSNVNEQ